MPNDIFEINRDLSIRYFNQSLSAYVDIVADSFEIDIDRGVDIEQGVFASGSVGTATVRMVKQSLSDFLNNPGYKAGDLFDIRYKPNPDTAPSTYNIIYSGYIQNISMGYINESGSLEITIVANDVMRYCMNAILPSFSITGTVAQRSYRNSMSNLIGALSSASTFSPAGVSLTAVGAGAFATTQRADTWLNRPSGEIFKRFTDAELGWFWCDKAVPNNVKYMARGDIDAKKAVTFNSANPTVSNVHYTDKMNNGTFETNTTNWSSGTSVVLARDTSTFYNGVASMNVSTNYVTNSFFETNVTGWSGFGTTGMARATSFNRQSGGPIGPYSGTGFMMTSSPPGTAVGALYITSNTGFSLPLTAGVSYTVSARNITYFNTSVNVAINWYNGGTFISQSGGPGFASSNSSWKEIAFSATAPAGTTRAEVVGFTVNAFGGYEESGWDNFMLEQTSRRSLPYSAANTSTMTFSALDKVKGSVYVKALTNTSTSLIQLDFINSGGGVISSLIGPSFPVNETNWTEVSVTGVAPTGTVRMNFYAVGNKTADGPGVMWIDNAKLQNLTTISANHYCLDSINLNYDSDILVNKAVVVDILGGTRTVASFPGSIAANGERADDFEVHFDSAAGPTTFANLASRIANAASIKQVYGVTVPVIRDDGVAGTIANFEVGDTLQVEFAQDPLPALQVVSLISRINHVITPQHWEMNIGLWRAI
jgi:hypothetical protein